MMKIFIVSNDYQWNQNVKSEILVLKSDADCSLLRSGQELLSSLSSYAPDVIVIDAILRDYDGLELLDAIGKMNVTSTIVFASPIVCKEVISEAIKLGADYYCINPNDPKVVAKRALGVLPDRNSDNPDREKPSAVLISKASYDEKITNIFMTVGVPPHIRGYQYLREGIKLAIETPSIINSITKKLYPLIAERFETTASKVERAIRHAITVTWNRGALDPSKKILGIAICNCAQKPTNGEFIALIADRILIESINN